LISDGRCEFALSAKERCVGNSIIEMGAMDGCYFGLRDVVSAPVNFSVYLAGIKFGVYHGIFVTLWSSRFPRILCPRAVSPRIVVLTSSLVVEFVSIDTSPTNAGFCAIHASTQAASVGFTSSLQLGILSRPVSRAYA